MKLKKELKGRKEVKVQFQIERRGRHPDIRALEGCATA
jgi:hypothetical protein